MIARRENDILMDIAKTLANVSNEDGMYLNYVKICLSAIELLKKVFGEQYQFPVDVIAVYEKLGIRVRKENLNEFMDGGDQKKVNRIIGKISIRPDYVTQESKTTVYVDESSSPEMINYALAHELCHLILNYENKRYTDDYCMMPMLPKVSDEMVADAFAIFLLIPFDKFLDTFSNYIKVSKDMGEVPIGTKSWLNHLSAMASVPYYYVACAYQQIRHVSFLIYKMHTENENDKMRYGEESVVLYDLVESKLTDENINLLYQ